MTKKNKFNATSKYFTISVYVVVVSLIICLMIKILFFWDSCTAALSDLFSTLSPFLIGLLIAFLINPLVSWFKQKVFTKWIHLNNKALGNMLSIVCAYLLVLCFFVICLIYIIPELIATLQSLIIQIPGWAETLLNLVTDLAARFPSLDFSFITDSLSDLSGTLRTYLTSILQSLTSSLVVTGVSLIKLVVNFVVAIIVSCYIIIDKKTQGRSFKRMIYACFNEQTAKKIGHIVMTSLRIFSNYFDGKMLDSLIIGIICFFGMIIIGLLGAPGFLSLALLISVVICVTNMIPYIGPFIGAIPSAILLLFYSPYSCLIFVIFILVLQQLDGNIIGPRILGTFVGLRPLWILFAVTVGGWVAGPIGMLIGVPIVAVISHLCGEFIDERLDKKGIDMPVIANTPISKKKQDAIKEQATVKNNESDESPESNADNNINSWSDDEDNLKDDSGHPGE